MPQDKTSLVTNANRQDDTWGRVLCQLAKRLARTRRQHRGTEPRWCRYGGLRSAYSRIATCQRAAEFTSAVENGISLSSAEKSTAARNQLESRACGGLRGQRRPTAANAKYLPCSGHIVAHGITRPAPRKGNPKLPCHNQSAKKASSRTVVEMAVTTIGCSQH